MYNDYNNNGGYNNNQSDFYGANNNNYTNANNEIKYRNKINSEIKHNPETIFE